MGHNKTLHSVDCAQREELIANSIILPSSVGLACLAPNRMVMKVSEYRVTGQYGMEIRRGQSFLVSLTWSNSCQWNERPFSAEGAAFQRQRLICRERNVARWCYQRSFSKCGKMMTGGIYFRNPCSESARPFQRR